jgi:hypothetical protein
MLKKLPFQFIAHVAGNTKKSFLPVNVNILSFATLLSTLAGQKNSTKPIFQRRDAEKLWC